MTAPTDDPIRFPEPRRAALRAMLLEETAAHGDGEPLEILQVSAPGPGADDRHRRRRRVAATVLATAAAAAVVVTAVLLPIGRHGATPGPGGPATGSTTGTSTSTSPSPARTGLYIAAVPTVRSGQPAENGWTASSCPYLEHDDVDGLLGAGAGDVWSGTSTPVRCRVFAPTGAPLLDITTLAYDAPSQADDAASELRTGASDVQDPRTQYGDPALGPATVTAFRTDGLTGGDAGWAATVVQGSTAFLVRVAPALDRTAVDRVVAEVVDVATGPGGSALTTVLRLCSHDLGGPFASALIGGQVTCSFGGDHATDVSVQYGSCPDGSDYAVIWSTAEDATDHATYYGSQSTTLRSSPAPPSAVLQSARDEVCP